MLSQISMFPDGRKQIVCSCQACGDQMQWMCYRDMRMARWRVEQYVNMHLHGVGRPVRMAMPR